MAPNQQSLSEALQAFAELHADHSIPVHYGTFDLSDEHLKVLYSTAETGGILKKPNILPIGKT